MTNITYDRTLDIDSSLITDAMYNSETSDLFLEMGAEIYHYADVPVTVVDTLENSTSAGRVFNNSIKGRFQSENLGFWADHFYTDLNADDEDDVEDEESGVDEGRIATADEVREKMFSLTPIVNEVTATVRKHTVNFTVGFESVVKTYTVNASSVDEAISELQKVADMLGVRLVVREVTVHFV